MLALVLLLVEVVAFSTILIVKLIWLLLRLSNLKFEFEQMYLTTQLKTEYYHHYSQFIKIKLWWFHPLTVSVLISSFFILLWPFTIHHSLMIRVLDHLLGIVVDVVDWAALIMIGTIVDVLEELGFKRTAYRLSTEIVSTTWDQLISVLVSMLLVELLNGLVLRSGGRS